MTFTQITFFIFFPIAVLAYYLIPQRFRYVWLLFCSCFFYVLQDAAMPLYLLAAALITYIGARIIDKYSQNKNADTEAVNAANTANAADTVGAVNTVDTADAVNTLECGKSKKAIWPLAISILLLLCPLAFFKYFALDSFGLIMPIGISFFTFQALSYLIDVYRGDAACEKNFLKVALYVSFFPVILSGPIQRGKVFMPQLSKAVCFDTDRVKKGLFYMLWGYFLKIAIAGRLSILTSQVLNGYMNYTGLILIIAIVAYAFLIYCDFAGYSYIAIGAGLIMGFDLGINFRRPYLSGSIGEFWRRWHISLSGWFKDYVYIPLGGSRRGQCRKYINVMIVFALSGIWHGNTVNFLIWGLLNGAYQVMGQYLAPLKAFFVKITRLDNHLRLRRVLNVIGSFILLDIAWIFFAVDKTEDSINIISRIMSTTTFSVLTDGTLFTLGLGRLNLVIALLLVLLLIISDLICEHFDADIADLLPRIPALWRWIMYYALTTAVVLSVNLSRAEFIYSKF